jgi:transposase InsO family protein
MSAEGRETLSLALARGHSLRTMISVSGRAPSTVSREHPRNTARGHGIGENRIARLMRIEGIWATPVKKWRATTDSGHMWPGAVDTLTRQFQVAQPNRVWAGDIPTSGRRRADSTSPWCSTCTRAS